MAGAVGDVTGEGRVPVSGRRWPVWVRGFCWWAVELKTGVVPIAVPSDGGGVQGSDTGPGLRNNRGVIPIYLLLPADLLMAQVVG